MPYTIYRSLTIGSLVFLGMWMFTFSSCGPERIEPPGFQYPQDGPGIALNLNLFFEDEETVLFVKNENVLGQQMQLETVKLYLSNIRLTALNGDEVLLSDVEIFDVQGNRLTVNLDAPVGEYAGIHFDVGVPTTLNGTDNVDFETFIYQDGHPLASNNGMYWAWQTGYRFFIYDGRIDTVGASPTAIPSPFSIHMGTDTTLLPLSFDQAFQIVGNDLHTAQINLDLARCIYNELDTMDLSNPLEANFHGGANIELAMRFREFLKGAIDVEVD